MTNRMPLAFFGEFEERIDGIFDRGVYANNGPLVQECDRALAELSGRTYGAALCSDMTAMMLAARAVFAPGQIMIPETLDSRMVEALAWGGFEAVTVVLDGEGRLRGEAICDARTERTSGIIGALPFGRGNPAEIEHAAQKLGLPLLFDGSDAFGGRDGSRPLVAFGLATVLSFRDDQVVAAAGSGAVVTDDEELWNRIRTMRNFHPSQTFAQEPLRMNAKMGEGAAALLLSMLPELDDLIADRRKMQREIGGRIVSNFDAEIVPADGADSGSFIIARTKNDVAGLAKALSGAGFDAARLECAPDLIAVRVIEPN